MGKKTINLSLGEPSASLPKQLLDKVSQEMVYKKIGYTESIGLFDLRKAIVKHYEEKYNILINTDQVAITAGASASILLTLISIFNTGDTIAIISPGYPCYENILKALNFKVFTIYTSMNNNFNLDIKQIKNLPSYIKGIIISSPANPTGVVLENLKLKEINEVCVRKNIFLISDEIYHGINYQNKSDEKSLLSFNKNGIVVNSFSKYFLMTGWRLGWIISNVKHIKKISKLAMNIYLSPSSISQYTALETFKYYDYFDQVVLDYLKKRNFLKKRLVEIGFDNFYLPKGGFYFYINISELTNDSFSFCKKMVSDINITTAPGIDFDSKNGKYFIRLSFAGAQKDLAKALIRIEKWL